MAFYLDRLQSLEQAILDSFEHDSSDFVALKERVTSITIGTTDLAGDLEICFKAILSTYLDSGSTESCIERSPLIRLISFAFEFALQYQDANDNVPKIPFQLIEDVLEHQTIYQAKQIWAIIETWVCKITNPVMFSKGKLVVLKTCNSLLRKLSKSCDTEFCGRILMFLADVFPLSEPSALNLAGRVNTSNVTYFDSAEKFATDASSSVPTITYDLYEAFWKLQSSFASNAKPFEATTFDDFLLLARKTIDVFSLVSLNTVLHHKQKNASNAYQGNKYLTSSQLFTLQLNDPSLKQQIGVQMFFYVHFLILKGLPTISDIPLKNKYAKELLLLHNSAKLLIEDSSNGNSNDLSSILRRILSREEFWYRWKSKTCPDFVRKVTDPVVGQKRKVDDLEGDYCRANNSENDWANYLARLSKSSTGNVFDCSDEHVKEVARFLADTCPSLDSLMDTYLEADDPDMGIEEEYHPKNDHLFCWRTRRLLAENNLDLFAAMSNGDLGKGIRKLRHIPEPEVKSVDILEDDEDENESEEVEAVIDAKASDDGDTFDLYDFMKEDVRAVGSTQEPEDGEVEDV